MRVFGRTRPPQREDHDLLDASLAVAQTQMLGQLADETALDGRTMGILDQSSDESSCLPI